MMINLKCRTEFTFREVYGPIEKVLDATQGPIGICDRNGTWGHVQFEAACKKAGRKALLGVELAVVEDAKLKEKQGVNWMSMIATNDLGLRELYELVSISTEPENYYYVPRIDYTMLREVSSNILLLSGSHPVWSRLPKRKNLFVELSPASHLQALEQATRLRLPIVATSDNFYPRIEDREAYEVSSGRERQNRTTPMHLLREEEWRLMYPEVSQEAISNQQAIALMCTVQLPRATMVHFDNPKPLRKMCEQAAKSRGINLKDKQYADRLTRELKLIEEKKFEDYFYLVADIIQWAKKRMLVGPARGSSCGSLVCYLLSITEIDPLPYALLFERFIDVNRKDLPDIDIDFPDDRRDLVFAYIHEKYGDDCVARLGTVLRYKAKSTISDVAKSLGIPAWEVSNLKNAIIERSTGDSRAAFCILDTFNDLEVGRQTLEKYPQLKIAAAIENHAKAKGQHAAGIVVTADSISRYCSIDRKTGAAQVDKHDAETLNLLKIDALGLRTLSVIQDCLDQVGWEREKLIRYRTDDEEAFAILNEGKFSGIFQFEGYALQSLCKQLTVENFEDIAALTALARPGPLNSGGATEYLRRRVGEHEVSHLHPLIAHTTQVTYGVVIYQEQVMQIAREMGQLSWEDVSSLRKAMSKSMGKEFFDGFWERFRVGAAKQGVAEPDAKLVWDNINTMGSWSFNRSHAVAYGMVSYWTMLLKAKFPLQFATACLRNARDEDQCIQLLRELTKEGFQYRAFDMELSEKTWAVKEGVLIGGLVNVRGIGEKTAEDIIDRRKRGEPLTLGQRTKLANAVTPFDTVFECEERWGHIKRNPEQFNIRTPITDIAAITQEDEGDFLVIGQIKEKDLRDLNELSALQKRGGKRVHGQCLYLNITVEDDTGSIIVSIDRHHYLTWGLPIVEKAKIGDWFLWKGNMRKGFRRLYSQRWRRLGEKEELMGKMSRTPVNDQEREQETS
jgi:DNA polymerase III alpha subunit